MSLTTAHKILIATAIVFFLFYAGFEVKRGVSGGDGWAYLRAAVSLAVAVGFARYYRTIKPV